MGVTVAIDDCRIGAGKHEVQSKFSIGPIAIGADSHVIETSDFVGRAGAWIATIPIEAGCTGASPVLVIETDGTWLTVSVKPMPGISVQGGGEFACGLQDPARAVVAAHDAKPDDVLRSAGDLRSIESR